MKHTAIITDKPELSGIESIPDGAFCGNGDIGAVLGNSENGVLVYLTKCDFWLADEKALSDGGISPVAKLFIDVPELLYNNYYVEQRMDEGELFLSFKNGSDYYEIRLFVCATENAVLFETKTNLNGIAEPRLAPFECKKSYETVSEELKDGVTYITRAFHGENLSFLSSAKAAMRRVFENEAEKKYVICIFTNHDDESFSKKCESFINDADASSFGALSDSHSCWWRDFWGKSSFSLSDAELENAWYASQYTLAVCARNKKFPPGIYGNFITKNTVNWKGDYHLNYNYQAPFYALAASNHTELTDCYVAPLEAFVSRGREYGKKIGCKGIYYPVGIGPKGMLTEKSGELKGRDFERLFLGQKSNAVHAADILIFRWNLTRDKAYAKEHIYPYLKECALFWESYLVKENGRYNIYKDAIHEIPYYSDSFVEEEYTDEINSKNNLLTIGLLKMLFSALIDISAALNEDEESRSVWAEILENLPPYPTQIKNFKKVFRYTEKGLSWNDRNFLCLQHVYPAGTIDFKSDKKLLSIARNTFFVNDRFDDDNAASSVFPCAVRLGISPELIIDRLKSNRKKFLLPNMLFRHGGGCLENSPVAANTLNEMALGFIGNRIFFFPNWDKRLDCEYKNLRTNGAFLVSAKIKSGIISGISVTSEKGLEFVFNNPYKTCEVNGRVYDSETVTIETEIGEKILILPAE